MQCAQSFTQSLFDVSSVFYCRNPEGWSGWTPILPVAARIGSRHSGGATGGGDRPLAGWRVDTWRRGRGGASGGWEEGSEVEVVSGVGDGEDVVEKVPVDGRHAAGPVALGDGGDDGLVEGGAHHGPPGGRTLRTTTTRRGARGFPSALSGGGV